jgi:glycosyltransferase involved in cell wall biosynthesis
MKPDISIVIPLYNKGPYIKRTIDSILAQTYQDFEIIIVDAPSTDEGPDIVKQISDPRIQFCNQEKTGVSDARNHGVRKAKADFIAFIDADDEWTPIHLETLVHLREKYPHAGIFVTAYKKILPDGTERETKYMSIPPAPWEGLLPSYFRAAALGEAPVATIVTGIPKNILLEVGGFPEDMRIGEDLDTWLRIAVKYPIAFSWNIGGIYHMEATNRTGDMTYSQRWEERLIQQAKITLQKNDVPENLASDLTEYIAALNLSLVGKSLRVGNYAQAKEILNYCPTTIFRRKKMVLTVAAYLPFYHLIYDI